MVLVMQSEKCGVKIDPTLALQGLENCYLHSSLVPLELLHLVRIAQQKAHRVLLAHEVVEHHVAQRTLLDLQTHEHCRVPPQSRAAASSRRPGARA